MRNIKQNTIKTFVYTTSKPKNRQKVSKMRGQSTTIEQITNHSLEAESIWPWTKLNGTEILHTLDFEQFFGVIRFRTPEIFTLFEKTVIVLQKVSKIETKNLDTFSTSRSLFCMVKTLVIIAKWFWNPPFAVYHLFAHYFREILQFRLSFKRPQ